MKSRSLASLEIPQPPVVRVALPEDVIVACQPDAEEALGAIIPASSFFLKFIIFHTLTIQHPTPRGGSEPRSLARAAANGSVCAGVERVIIYGQ